jgi:hypothetical protein
VILINKLVGFKHSFGSSKDDNGREFSWDNMLLYILSDTDSDTVGLGCNIVKVKTEAMPGMLLDGFKLDDLLEQEVELITGLVNSKLSITGIKLVA